MRAQHRIVETAHFIPAILVGEFCSERGRTVRTTAGNHAAFVTQQIFGDIPALVDFIDDRGNAVAIFLRHLHIVEERLAEGGLAGNQHDRLGRHTFAGHVEQHEGNALVLFILVGAGEAEDPVGLVSIAGPDFLAVDDKVIAFIHRTGLQRGQIGAGARLGIALAPADFAARDRRQEMLLLRFGAEMQQRGAEHPDAKARQWRPAFEPRHFLPEDFCFGARQSAAAIFLWPVGHGPALCGHDIQPLFLTGLEGRIAAAPDGIALVDHRLAHLRRAVGLKPGGSLCAEGFQVRHHEIPLIARLTLCLS